MKFKENIDPIYTDDFWYDLFEGGYIKPSALLKDQKTINIIEDALDLLKEFKEEAEANEIVLDS